MPLRSITFSLLLLLFTACTADVPSAEAQLQHLVQDVKEPEPRVVMNLAAHPDDEDGATMAYYRYAKNAVVYSVLFTRGEGGQNEIGPELYEALGAIRTDETERAARHLGTQVYFLNFYDFGYSKTADETFDKWGGRDHVTAQLVYLIRRLKPDVLFTNHDTLTVGPNRQHGQHQAVGIAGYDAFALAADPGYHPEQLAEDGVDLWQPKRLFLRHFLAEARHDVSVPVGDTYEPLGQSYAAIAADAIGEHASQGMDMFAQRVRRIDANHFELLRSATDAPLDTTDLAGNLPPNTAARPGIDYFIDAGRVASIPEDSFVLSDSLVVPGQHIRLEWDPGMLSDTPLRWAFSGAIDTTLLLNDTSPGVVTFRVSAGATPSVPEKVYQYKHTTSHPPVVYALYRADTDSLLAAGYLPLAIGPPVYLETPESVVRLQAGANRLPVLANVYDPEARSLVLNVAVTRDTDQNVLFHEEHPLLFDGAGRATDTLTLHLPKALPPGAYTITLTALAKPATHIPIPAVARAEGRVFQVDVPPGLRVGVIQSYDNTLEQALRQLGVDYVMLDSLALAEARFDDLHTILVDIRAYLVRQDLRLYNDQLLDWVQQGGHLVVNYQKVFEWNPQYPDPFDRDQTNPEDGFAPYPLVLGRDRVTREDASVEVLMPDHPLLNQPNVISEDAWDGWVQERGLYFPATWDDAYEELVCMHDPGEQPHCGSTLLAAYGEGTYLFTALVWYRQLKMFHPGSYAVFANLISLPLVDDRASSAP